MTTSRLSTFALVMLITGAIDSVRNLPATALFGSTLIFFFIFSAIVFLIPAALVSAELSSTSSERGGVYHWVQSAFGEKTAFLAIWLQWINTMVWFPTILSFIAGTAAYLVNPDLAQNKIYLITVILVTFWFVTFLNLKGIQISARFANVCALVGMVAPLILIIGLAVIWGLLGKPLQVNLSFENIVPKFDHSENWISLTAIMTAFLGMELAMVHVREIHNPQKTFPRALLFSVVLILVTMIFGSLAIAFVLPQHQIGLTSGVMQAFTNFFGAYHMAWLIPMITVMLLLGSLGQMVSWIISPAKGLLQAAQLGYMPKFFSKENSCGAPGNLLIIQAVLVTVICLAFLLMPSVNGSYWLLTALSTQLYMLMYVLMFLAAIFLRYKHADYERGFTIPGGKFGMLCTCILGLIGCAITLTVGFFPPEGINVGTAFHYHIIFGSGMIVMILPVLFFYYYRSYSKRALRC